MKFVLSHILNYQTVSIAFAIIISVALQEWKEFNRMPYMLVINYTGLFKMIVGGFNNLSYTIHLR